jgi:serine/threonine protein kinase
MTRGEWREMIVEPMDATEPRFEVVRWLGAGATARVELVRLTEPFQGLSAGTELAKKTLATAHEHEASARAAFAAEAAAGAEVRSPSLVRVLYHGSAAGEPYLLMQYVPGRTLREVLESDGPQPEPRVRAIGAELAQALAALHAHGLVHGDVKPENVRLDEEGRAVLLDLGFARRARTDPRGPLSAISPEAGSLAYLAPERVRGDPGEAPADVFALGIVLYELATGIHPFAKPSGGTRLFGRISTSGAILRRSIELTGADELLASLAEARSAPPSRFAPSLSPLFDQLAGEMLARASSERPRAEELAERLSQGENGDWWRAHLDQHTLAQGSVEELEDPSSWPLVGRESELGALAHAYEELEARERPRASVVWLVGPEGSGKWRLLSSFARRARASRRPPLVLETRWNEADESRPAGALLMLLNRWLGLPAGRAPRAREEQRLSELVGAANARALLLALDPKTSGSMDRSIPAELARWLARLSETGALCVFLDDVHQAGEVTLDALSSMLELLRACRIFFVLALREDVPAAEPHRLARLRERLERGSEAGPRVERLSLAPLERTAVEALVARLFHEEVPRARLGEVLWNRSRGNPGFLTEILRELESRGGVRPHSDEDGRLVLTIAPEELPMPRSLDKLIQERLAALEPHERTWLERMSVVGGRLTPEFLQAAFPPTKRPEIDAVLASLTRKGWLVPAADRYRFERPALREALYRSLSAARRRRLHGSAARALGADSDDLEEAFQRAYHLQAAGEHKELLDSVRHGLRALRRRASAQRLAMLARWGLEALEALGEHEGREELLLEFLEDAADAADRLGQRADQRELLDHLANLALDPEKNPSVAARLYLLHARYAAGTGQYGLARGWLKSATLFAERSRDRWLLSQALRRLAQVQAQIGEFGDARRLAKRALKVARGENQAALAHLALAHVDVLEDEPERALAAVRAALETLRKSDEPRAGVLAYAELLRGRLWRSIGLPGRALGAIQRALVLARRAGERRVEAEALARRGAVLRDLGRAAQAKAELRDARLLSDEIEDRRGQVLSTLLLGELEALEGEAHANSSLRRAVELAGEIAFYRAEALGLAWLASLSHQDGATAEAERDSARALELLARHGAELADRVVITATRARLLRARGREGEAQRILAELERRARASQRRIRDRELRHAHRAFSESLLRGALNPPSVS